MNVLQVAFVDDSLENTKTLSYAINNPDGGEFFAYISYNKGAAVIKMFESTYGSDKFAEALTSYLSKK